MYISNDNWKNWMKDFKFGTLVFIPSGELRNKVDSLRMYYDPTSAKNINGSYYDNATLFESINK